MLAIGKCMLVFLAAILCGVCNSYSLKIHAENGEVDHTNVSTTVTVSIDSSGNNAVKENDQSNMGETIYGLTKEDVNALLRHVNKVEALMNQHEQSIHRKQDILNKFINSKKGGGKKAGGASYGYVKNLLNTLGDMKKSTKKISSDLHDIIFKLHTIANAQSTVQEEPKLDMKNSGIPEDQKHFKANLQSIISTIVEKAQNSIAEWNKLHGKSKHTGLNKDIENIRISSEDVGKKDKTTENMALAQKLSKSHGIFKTQTRQMHSTTTAENKQMNPTATTLIEQLRSTTTHERNNPTTTAQGEPMKPTPTFKSVQIIPTNRAQSTQINPTTVHTLDMEDEAGNKQVARRSNQNIDLTPLLTQYNNLKSLRSGVLSNYLKLIKHNGNIPVPQLRDRILKIDTTFKINVENVVRKLLVMTVSNDQYHHGKVVKATMDTMNDLTQELLKIQAEITENANIKEEKDEKRNIGIPYSTTGFFSAWKLHGLDLIRKGNPSLEGSNESTVLIGLMCLLVVVIVLTTIIYTIVNNREEQKPVLPLHKNDNVPKTARLNSLPYSITGIFQPDQTSAKVHDANEQANVVNHYSGLPYGSEMSACFSSNYDLSSDSETSFYSSDDDSQFYLNTSHVSSTTLYTNSSDSSTFQYTKIPIGTRM